MVAVQSTALPAVTRRCSCLRSLRNRGIDAARRRPPHARRTGRSTSPSAAAAMRRAQPSTIRHGNGARRPEAPERSLPTETILRAELPPGPELCGTNSVSRISEVRGSAAVSRHLHESSPGEKAGGGLFSDFEAVRTATVPSAHRRASSTRCSAIRNEVRGSWSWVLVWAP